MKIITTVGTSLISNSPEDCSNLESENFAALKFEPENTFFKTHIKPKEEALFKSIGNSTASAELASLTKIDPDGQADIYLLCTETVTSYMCGRILQRHLGERSKVQYVEGLQVKVLDDFKKRGVPNLLTAIEKIAQGGHYWDDVVLNVTGGYKAIIPIMTIIGQIKRLPTFYIFKGEDDRQYELIEIPKMPVDYQTDVFETYWETFSRFGTVGEELQEKQALINEFLTACEGFLEVADDMVTLNPVGKILWWNYQQQYFFLNTTDNIWSEIQGQEDIKRILETKLHNTEIRSKKTERKQDHYVFDDGNNNNRIYYFEDQGRVYVYKTFQNEEKAKAYINTPFDNVKRADFVRESMPFRIPIKR